MKVANDKSPEEYKNIIRKLKMDNKKLFEENKDLRKIKEEKITQEEKIKSLEAKIEELTNVKNLSAVGRETQKTEKLDLKREMSKIKQTHVEEIKVMLNQIDMLKEQLEERENEISELRYELDNKEEINMSIPDAKN